jgi:hypothetical protein
LRTKPKAPDDVYQLELDRIPVSRARAKEAAEGQEAGGEFAAYVQRSGSDAGTLTSERRAELFREFVQWRDQQRGSAQR